MGKITEFFAKLKSTFSSMSISRKIAIGVIVFGVVLAIVIYSLTLGKTNYVTLFSDLSPTDSKTILAKLDEKKTQYKVDATTNSILVPESEAGALKLSLASTVSNGSTGFELFDQAATFGMTTEEFKVKYQRAIQGEIERSIKTNSNIQNSRVTIVMPEESNFLKAASSASASVVLILKPGSSLVEDQVKGIINLVALSVKNLPKDKITVMDDKFNLLSEGIYTSGTDNNTSNTNSKQNEEKLKIETGLENKVLTQLEPVYGKGKIKVKVNLTLNFDQTSIEKVTTEKDPAKVSEHGSKTMENAATGTTSTSPVDNAMSAVIGTDGKTGTTTNTDLTINYNSTGKTTEQTSKASGTADKITASVYVNSKKMSTAELDDLKAQVNKIIGQIDGRDNDTMVQALEFNKDLIVDAGTVINEMNGQSTAATKVRLFYLIGVALGAILFSIMVFAVIKKRRRIEDEKIMEEASHNIIDATIDDVKPKPIEDIFESMNLDVRNEKTHRENEIKNYATDKPEQVLEIIKTWIAHDEEGS